MNNPIQPVGGGVGPRVLGEARPTETRQRSKDLERAEREPAQPDRESLINLAERIEFGGRTAEFTYNQDLDRIVVKVYSSATEPREIVREIPPEEYLAFASRFREMIGLLFDERV